VVIARVASMPSRTGIRVHQDHEAAADQRLVIGDHDADRRSAPPLGLMSLLRRSVVGMLALTRKPAACGPAASSPPKRAARSRIPISP
jgi:hypothetical protein